MWVDELTAMWEVKSYYALVLVVVIILGLILESNPGSEGSGGGEKNYEQSPDPM